MIEYFCNPKIPPPGGHYSPVTRFGDLLFSSGHLPIVAGAEMVKCAAAPFEEQVSQTLANLLDSLAYAGAGREAIAKVTAYIVGVENWPRFNEVYASIMGPCRPARSVVPVPELHHGFLVEIEAVAGLPPAQSGDLGA